MYFAHFLLEVFTFLSVKVLLYIKTVGPMHRGTVVLKQQQDNHLGAKEEGLEESNPATTLILDLASRILLRCERNV